MLWDFWNGFDRGQPGAGRQELRQMNGSLSPRKGRRGGFLWASHRSGGPTGGVRRGGPSPSAWLQDMATLERGIAATLAAGHGR